MTSHRIWIAMGPRPQVYAVTSRHHLSRHLEHGAGGRVHSPRADRAVSSGQWIEVDVTPLVAGDGTRPTRGLPLPGIAPAAASRVDRHSLTAPPV